MKEIKRRKRIILGHTGVVFLIIAIIVVSCDGKEGLGVSPLSNKVILGIEVFLQRHLDLVKGKRVGLITNPTGVDSQLRSTIDLFYKNPGINLIALYGPEHGVRGNAQAGEYVAFYKDERSGLPVFSLYGQSMKPVPEMLKSIDGYMRSFDIKELGKSPEKAMVKSLDVMIFDIQDVGTRVYTYIATMAYCMQACAESGIDFIILDRPNPINGIDMEGPILEYPAFSSFVGLYPIPMRHGMTAGELGKLFNEKFLKKKVKLTVIPMEGWERKLWYDETSLPWVIPSPNMPTLETASVYPGQVLLEGTNISEGRGSTKPFELFGSPWIDGYELARKLNKLNLPGVRFREAWFTPLFSKYQGKPCGGTQIHILNRKAYKPFESSLHIIKTIMDSYPDQFQFHAEYFDKIIGTSKIREAMNKGVKIQKIVSDYENELEVFSKLRKPYLIY